MAQLFEAVRLNNIEAENRFVRSATWEGLATPEGFPTDALKDVLVGLARGGVGIIISGHTYVSPEGQAGPHQQAIYSDDHLAPLKPLTAAVHKAGGKIVAQLAHAGVRANRELTGSTPIGPSAFERDGMSAAGMDGDDLRRVARAFAAAAGRAKEAGFDGVQVHAAHGYLLSQFLSPRFNKRQDRYGGRVVGRARLLLETVTGVRAAVGPDFAVTVKINAEDFEEGGFTVDDMLSVSAMLEAAGIDAMEMSGGTPYGAHSPSRSGKAAVAEGGAYYLAAARRYKEKIGVPLMLVGGIRAYDVAERLAGDGTADYISLSRPLIAEPDLVSRWKSGDRRPAFCKSDNLCFKPGFEGRGVYCVTREKAEGREAR
jgi:2,4-dienoyl-CoA reductase-like NADH-dependent reductase (Old Yellow Enzyme family)